ncbi:MAG: DoxX family protein [Chloroflexota bacterium]
MKYALWIVQILVAIAFIGSGSMKVLTPYNELITDPNMAWATSLNATLVNIIGILEVLGGIGLILPAVTGILPILTPLAGAGLALTMVGAAILHIARGEWGAIVINLVLGGLALFAAYGRYRILPIPPRGSTETAAA